MSKILLIDPFGWQGAVNGYRPFPNIGIAYLIPMLWRSGHQVSIIDLNNEDISDKQVLSKVSEYRPNLIAFSVKTATMNYSRNLARKIKGFIPEVPIMIGGPHTSVARVNLQKEHWIDIIFIGEGEQIFPLICGRIANNHSVEDIPGVVTENNFGNDYRDKTPLINTTDLEGLPFPDYSLFPQSVKESLSKGYPLVTSRGCVYNCTYCSVPKISGKGFRKRSPKSVIEELRWSQEKYDTTAFEIIDDVFNFDIERCKEICISLIEADLGMTWSCPNGLRADRVDQELAELMFKSGCRSVMVGVESADPTVLAAVKKGESIKDIERGICKFREAGINVGGYFIIGLPGDSYQANKHSLDFAKKAGINAHFNMLVPYPGTQLWRWAEANARFLGDPEDGLHFADSSHKVNPVIETSDFPAVERQRAYEMVHTRLGRFNMLIPSNLPRWQYYSQLLRLLWSYDRAQLPVYVFRAFIHKWRRLLRRWTKPALLILSRIRCLGR